MVYHALGISRGARRVVERDGIPLLLRTCPLGAGITLRDQFLVRDLTEALDRLQHIVFDEHDGGRRLGDLERRSRDLGETLIDEEEARFPMVEDKGNDLGVESGVDHVENCARHRHAERDLHRRRRVMAQDRDSVVLLHAPPPQCIRKSPAAHVRFSPSPLLLSVPDRAPLRVHGCRSLQKRQR